MSSKCSPLQLSQLVLISLLYKTGATPGISTPEEYSSEHVLFLLKVSKARLSVIYILGEIKHPLHWCQGHLKISVSTWARKSTFASSRPWRKRNLDGRGEEKTWRLRSIVQFWSRENLFFELLPFLFVVYPQPLSRRDFGRVTQGRLNRCKLKTKVRTNSGP